MTARAELPFEYPPTPPAWLAAWPADQAVHDLFSAGIRSYAYRILQGRPAPHLRMDWDDERLIVNIGDQKATWRRQGDQWRRTCTCGYSNDRCAHLYVAATSFRQVLRRENWLARGGPVVARPPGGPADGPTPKPAAGAPLDQLELFGGQAPAAPAGAQRLEVEADLHSEPGTACVRFYLFQENRRHALRLQQVLNLAARVQHHSPGVGTWSEEDRQFLAWVAPQVRALPTLRLNPATLDLPRARFDLWLERWEDVPGRLLDRRSQQPLNRPGQGARLHIELTPEDEWVRIHAILTTPKGTRHAFHEVFEMLASNRREMILDGQMLAFEPPISWGLLGEVFAKRAPRLRRQHVCEHLPALLEGRLDLLRGPLVDRREVQGTPRVTAAQDGADVLIRAAIGGALVRPDSGLAAAGLSAADGRFVVTTHDSPLLPQVRAFLRSLELRRQSDGAWRLAGTSANLQALAAAWERLPEGVEREAGPELQALLNGPVRCQPELAVREGASFVDLHIRWLGGGVGIDDADVREAVRADREVFRTRGGDWIRLDLEFLRTQRESVEKHGFSTGTQRLLRSEVRRTLADLEASLPLALAAASRSLADRLLHEPPPELPALPATLEPILRPYQREGFDFLADRCAHRVGAILADDMGLGKTLQALAFLAARRRTGPLATTGGEGVDRGALVVCPASVVGVWQEQTARFCPELATAVYAGPADRRRRLLERGDWDLLVINYALVRVDAAALLEHTYAFVILDEAQNIKNPDSLVSGVVRQLRTPQPLALTGTPLENRALDLWSIMEFLNPGFLGPREAFAATYEAPGNRRELARRIAPVLLRRTKDKVAPQLPPRTEETIRVELGETQRRLYDGELARAREAVGQRGPIEVLAALTRLRQLCCHPDLLLQDGSVTESAKVAALLEMLEELLGEGHSALVFSQFTSLLARLEPELTAAGMPWLTLTGDTPTAERARLVQSFQEAPGPQVFLISLKAGGTGLTLTKADYVFLFDPWWNPAVERQAIDRTHRLGQERPVFAYRLVAANTVEEKVLELQASKAELFADVMADAEQALMPQRLSAADLAGLLA